MITYAKLKDFNITYEPIMQKFFIASNTGGQVEIGGFDLASQAIEFAHSRVK